MKINTDRLKNVSTKTDDAVLLLTFDLVPEEQTQVCGHYFKVEIVEIPPEIKRCLITIQGISNTYFPRSWPEWKPVIKNGDESNLVISHDSLTVEVTIHNGATSYSIEAYKYFDVDEVTAQLEGFQIACDHSMSWTIQPFSFIFGLKPKRLIIARQHPGEGVASSFTGGILKFLQTNKSKSEFIIVPAMALRGLRNGEYRTNSGYDLNRSWMEDVSEIRHVKSIIDLYNIKEVLDIHGDEVSKIDYARIEGNPDFRLPNGVSILAQSSWIRKTLSRLRNKVKTASKGCSLRDYCKSQKISCTLLELSMSKDDSFRLGLEFAETNLK